MVTPCIEADDWRDTVVISEVELGSLRVQLESELRGTTRELNDIDAQVRSFGTSQQDAGRGITNHIGDDSDLVFEQERLLTIRDRLASRHTEIKHALEKMDRGNYGICENCGQPIAPDRLAALPFVTLCIRCQALSERHREERR
jgi:DnaK suppressor protein